MKSHDLGPIMYQIIDQIESDLNTFDLSYILSFEEVEDNIHSSFFFDGKQNVMWYPEVKDVVEYAYGMTIIDKEEYEEFLLQYVMKLNKPKEKN